MNTAIDLGVSTLLDGSICSDCELYYDRTLSAPITCVDFGVYLSSVGPANYKCNGTAVLTMLYLVVLSIAFSFCSFLLRKLAVATNPNEYGP